jgi:leucyl/phenylalanyl-tRNA--protein transferase
MAEADGLVGVGGDLDPRRLLLGYANGIIPWYSEEQPILWFSPDPRFVLFPDRLHVPRSLRKVIRRGRYEVRLDTAFEEVILSCKQARRPRQRGTWITRGMLRSYLELHRLGLAHSAEAWRDGRLVGGLYGVSLGGLYSGESMYTREPDASKVAFVWLVRQLHRWGCGLIDSQIHTEHLARFGAENIPREEYLAMLPELVRMPTRFGPWRFDEGFYPLEEGPGAPLPPEMDARADAETEEA